MIYCRHYFQWLFLNWSWWIWDEFVTEMNLIESWQAPPRKISAPAPPSTSAVTVEAPTTFTRLTESRIRSLRRLILTPCNHCTASRLRCWMKKSSGKCAVCVEQRRIIAECDVAMNQYIEVSSTVFLRDSTRKKNQKSIEEGFAINECNIFHWFIDWLVISQRIELDRLAPRPLKAHLFLCPPPLLARRFLRFSSFSVRRFLRSPPSLALRVCVPPRFWPCCRCFPPRFWSRRFWAPPHLWPRRFCAPPPPLASRFLLPPRPLAPRVLAPLDAPCVFFARSPFPCLFSWRIRHSRAFRPSSAAQQLWKSRPSLPLLLFPPRRSLTIRPDGQDSAGRARHRT